MENGRGGQPAFQRGELGAGRRSGHGRSERWRDPEGRGENRSSVCHILLYTNSRIIDKTMPPLSSKPVTDESARRFQELKNELAQLEFFSKGTVLACMMTASNLQCPSHTKRAKRHGPYSAC